MKTLLALPLLAFALGAHAQFKPEEMMKPAVFTNETGEVFRYQIHVPQFPKEGESLPLILFLHGSGECGTDNMKQIKVGLPVLIDTLVRQSRRAIIVAPQCQRMPTSSWVQRLAMHEDYAMPREPTGALEAALQICDHVMATCGGDTNRFYITGLSLGGFGTWDAVMRWPDRFAAAVPICGGGDLRVGSRQLGDIPLWVAHGADDKSVPVDCSRRMVEVARLAGNRNLIYREYPKTGHVVWDRVYADGKFVEWLFKQTRAKPWWKFW